MKNILYIVLLALAMVSCNHYTPSPGSHSTLDTVLVHGYVTDNGAYYEKEGINLNVLSVDLYSETINFDKNGRIQGTGTNLYLSDLFLEPGATTIPNGTIICDTAVREMHCLPGMNYDGKISGAYLLLVGEDSYAVTLVTGGTIDVSHKGDTTIMDTNLTLEHGKTYRGHYRGVLMIKDKK